MTSRLLAGAVGLAVVVPFVAQLDGPRGYELHSVNDLRSEHHRVLLTVRQTLQQRAQRWANLIARRQRLADDLRGWRYCPAKHYAANAGVGWDVPDIESAFEHSSVHRSNILGRAYRWVGIGVATSRDGRIWITQEFCG